MSNRQQTVTKTWPSRMTPASVVDPRQASPAKRILVADDNEAMRTLMADILPSLGYAVTTAPDGPTAIAELGRCEPHLVLLDIEMPGIDGCEVCRRIKSHQKPEASPWSWSVGVRTPPIAPPVREQTPSCKSRS